MHDTRLEADARIAGGRSALGRAVHRKVERVLLAMDLGDAVELAPETRHHLECLECAHSALAPAASSMAFAVFLTVRMLGGRGSGQAQRFPQRDSANGVAIESVA